LLLLQVRMTQGSLGRETPLGIQGQETPNEIHEILAIAGGDIVGGKQKLLQLVTWSSLIQLLL
jgi:hypothetical protein